jgi:hypothetical protein
MHISAWSMPASATFCRQHQAPCYACLTPIENLEEAIRIGDDGVLKEAGKRSIEELELERARVLLGLLTTRPEGEKVAQASTADGRTPARTK